MDKIIVDNNVAIKLLYKLIKQLIVSIFNKLILIKQYKVMLITLSIFNKLMINKVYKIMLITLPIFNKLIINKEYKIMLTC
jgi:hypothetical protein